MVGDNEIRVVGLNSSNTKEVAKKAGLANSGWVDYVIVVFEERHQFSEKEINAVLEAVRAKNPNCQTVVFNVCNPWSKNSDYILYCGKYLQWDVQKLKTDGYQIKVVNIPLQDGYFKRAVFFYTNWRVAKDYLQETKIIEILDSHNRDKKRALTVDYGLPGYEDGAIYSHLLDRIPKAHYMEHKNLRGGMDWGWGHNRYSSKTAAVIFGSTLAPGSPVNGIDIYDVYTSDNRVSQKPNHIVYGEVLDFFVKNVREYKEKNMITEMVYLTVRVDSMNDTVIQSMKDLVRQRGYSAWLSFIPCKKDIPIIDRIELLRGMISLSFVRMHPQKCKPLLQELEFATFQDIETAKRTKKNDDCINALEYGLEPDMWKFARMNKDNLQFSKNLKRKY